MKDYPIFLNGDRLNSVHDAFRIAIKSLERQALSGEGTELNASLAELEEHAQELAQVHNFIMKQLREPPKAVQKVTNTAILLFICGYQGGTIHQLSEHILRASKGLNPLTAKEFFDGIGKVCTREQMTRRILEADPEDMEVLMRLAQTYRNLYRDKKEC